MWNLYKGLMIATAILTISPHLQAGSLCRPSQHRSSKCCDCATSFQPGCCRPKIVRPCYFHAAPAPRCCAKPDCCYQTECPATGCCPVSTSCDVAQTDCAPRPETCCASVACDDACCFGGAPRELTELVHLIQTGSNARVRRLAVCKLSYRFNCRCHPQVMQALVYALNDPDHRVRSKAADEIGDQLRESPCCCTSGVLCALKYALGDCDRFVRRQAEEALRCVGYDVVDGCCEARSDCCSVACDSTACSPMIATPSVFVPASPVEPVPPQDAAPTAPVGENPIAPPPEAIKPSRDPSEKNYSPKPDAPVPATPENPAAGYRPSQHPPVQQATRTNSFRRSLSNFFGQRR